MIAFLRQLWFKIRSFNGGCYCALCNTTLPRFDPFGIVPRPNALCPICGSLERHRLSSLYIRERTNFFDGTPRRVLHVAPEPPMTRFFKSATNVDYLSGDVSDPAAMVAMDITHIEQDDESFDVIYCSHVLEHIADDRRAMRELYRVLRTGGWGMLQVPITAEATFEEPSVTSPLERERLFGQSDHVRRYGPDYVDRLREVGFSLVDDDYAQTFDAREVRRLGLSRGDNIHFCQKGTLADRAR